MRVFCSCIRAQTYVALLFVCLWTLGHFWAIGRKRLTTLTIGTLTLSSLDPQKKSLLVCSLLTLSFGKHICCWIDCIFIYRSRDIFGSIINDSFRAQTLTRIPTLVAELLENLTLLSVGSTEPLHNVVVSIETICPIELFMCAVLHVAEKGSVTAL